MKASTVFLAATLALTLGVAGCGKKTTGPDDSKANGDGKTSSAKVPFPADKATASITGKIFFSGTAPKRGEIDMEGVKGCEKAHSAPVLDEEVVINPNKTVRDVFVQVTKFPAEWKFAVPKKPVVISQKGCVYVPHVIGIMRRQKLQVTSSDNWDHNVHFKGDSNRQWNETMKGHEKIVKSFKRAEIATLACDIHSWMGAKVCIVNHPFFAVTGTDGTFTLGKLPPGTYKIEIWHEVYGKQSRTVTLTDGKTTTVDFTLKAK